MFRGVVVTGKRKFVVAIFLGSLAFTAFMFTSRDLACLGALLAFLGIIARLYNVSNIEEHKNGSK